MEDWTCGKGLAANAELPARLSELAAAMAGLLQAHQRALTGEDPETQAERAAYLDLAERFGKNAADLRVTSERMRACHSLPAAPHDMAIMNDGQQLAAFEQVVEAKQRLLSLLQEAATEDNQALDEMRAGDASG